MGVSGERVVRSRTGQAEVIQGGGLDQAGDNQAPPPPKKMFERNKKKTRFLFGLLYGHFQRAFTAALPPKKIKIYIYI